jgi:hypothetical protein
MAGLVTVEWVDVNGIHARNSVYTPDVVGALGVVTHLKALSNARILSALFSIPLDLTTLSGNTAVAANVETARAKATVIMSADPAAAGLPRPKVHFEIPAPIGTLINGLSGDKTNTDIVALLSDIVTNRGETLNLVDNIIYSK